MILIYYFYLSDDHTPSILHVYISYSNFYVFFFCFNSKKNKKNNTSCLQKKNICFSVAKNTTTFDAFAGLVNCFNCGAICIYSC